MSHSLLGALPILAKMLGRKLGVEVVIGGSGAYTDGRTIHLPALPVENEPLGILANGYIDHEAAHVRYTDFTVEKPPGLAGELTNLLEDIRIERALGAAYPGTRANLARLVRYLATQRSPVPDPRAAITEQVFAALYCLLRARLLEQTALTAAAATLERRIGEALPEGVVTKLLALAFEVRKTTSTAGVKALALRIVAMLEDEARNDPPARGASRRGGGSGSDAGTAGEPSGRDTESGADAGTAGDDRAGANTPFGATDPAEARTGSDSAAEPDAGAAGGDPAASTGARHAALQALLRDPADAGGTDLGRRTGAILEHSAAGSAVQRVVMAEYDPHPANPDPRAACDAARAATARLRRRLATLVQASREDERWRGRRGRRLDGRGLYRLRVDDPAIFARRIEHDGPNTAVALLLDRSHSMRSNIDLAGRAILATALALEGTEGVAVMAAAFPGRHNDRLIPLKGFDEPLRRIAGRFRIGVEGGTPLANALWRAGFELCLRPEPRRLLIVATDGEPNSTEDCHRVIERCRASGIEVLGLGIGMAPDPVARVFGRPDSTVIRSIHELAPALFRVLEQRLVARA